MTDRRAAAGQAPKAPEAARQHVRPTPANHKQTRKSASSTKPDATLRRS